MNILITWLPKSGKTTLLKELIEPYEKKIGFVTNEIREDGVRTGFEIETHKWTKFMLASTSFKNETRVGKYGVDIQAISQAVPLVNHFGVQDLLFLDEIGQMELLANWFQELCRLYLNAPNICIATISQVYSDDFIDSIKGRDDIILMEITEENRDEEKHEIIAILHSSM